MSEINEDKQSKVIIFVISDSIGETAQRIIYAVLAQFPALEAVELKRYPFVDNEGDLLGVLNDAKYVNAVVITTLVSDHLNQIVANFTQKHNIKHVDYMSPLMNIITEQTNMQPIKESGALHRLDEDYFDRVAAIEFAVKYDDGKNPKGFPKSDIVILGISRTSKTPLSMYLANKAYKVSNLPLIPDVLLPKDLQQVEKGRIFGLTASPHYISRIRRERVKLLGLVGPTNYDSLERIKEELRYADEVFDDLGAHRINVENQSIEEIAQHIEDILQENQL